MLVSLETRVSFLVEICAHVAYAAKRAHALGILGTAVGTNRPRQKLTGQL